MFVRDLSLVTSPSIRVALVLPMPSSPSSSGAAASASELSGSSPVSSPQPPLLDSVWFDHLEAAEQAIQISSQARAGGVMIWAKDDSDTLRWYGIVAACLFALVAPVAFALLIV